MGGRGKRKAAFKRGESVKPGDDAKKKRPEKATFPEEIRKEIHSLYKLPMPEDFYHFWKFCEDLNPEDPCEALKSSLGLQLVGPYDILAGKHKRTKNSDLNYHLHWRHFYDPPEFQTVLIGDSVTQFHLGYFRLLLSKRLKEMSNKKEIRVLKDLDAQLIALAAKLDYSLDQRTKEMKQRDKKVLTKTFHGAGLVVPVDKNDVGYRNLPETDVSLKKICKAIVEAPNDEERIRAFAPIQEIITYVQFANDECDYGMGYELGMDLFCYGSHYFHKLVRQLLPLAYNLLKRPLFAEIIEVHLANRNWDNLDQLKA
ncbi:chromosome unknown open reading frame, human C4orf27 isoform X2 [Callorhinchus milii]|uniref:Histone PARylation factor 1 n=1 Tax=Callorhinchus milii TaxID=7868 RepID=V9L198_CALMI|nr:chromosome unknown open reading frame, human C4orf27 isoform X2 [Callorhinchus milii]|eukprot:gi/632956824/ref/XP_007894149.1/ PREDICTED: UPF0609 protein C4orf27 homolog isoform X2 [Callorhinchus milii]